MPEYLAPDVYIEEVDTGSKPIEGVSTSTCGFIGVTERGPANVPIMVTSAGEYQRWFGQSLNALTYGTHRFLPHAVDGFFTNGGKRLFVVRVLNQGTAAFADTDLYLQEPSTASAILLAPALAGATNALISGPLPLLAPGEAVRIGDGSDSEYRDTTGATAPDSNFLSLSMPLQFGHGVPTAIDHCSAFPAAPPTTGLLETTTAAGATTLSLIVMSGALPAAGPLVAMVNSPLGANNQELIYISSFVEDLASSTCILTLSAPLQARHDAAETVGIHTDPGIFGPGVTLSQPVQAGTSILRIGTAGFPAGNLVRIIDATPGNPHSELRYIGALTDVVLETGAYADYAAGTRFDHAVASDTAGAATVILDAPVQAGQTTITVSDRQDIAEGGYIRIGQATDATVEYIRVRSKPNPGPAATIDPGRLVLATPLAAPHGGATVLSRTIVTPQTLTATPDFGTLVMAAGAGATTLMLSNALATPFTGPDILRITTTAGDEFLHHVTAATATITPHLLNLVTPLRAPHDPGSGALVRTALLEVRALDQGEWGDRLRVAAATDPVRLVRSAIRAVVDPSHIKLDSPSGVEPGTILTVLDPAGAAIGAPMKVIAIDRRNDNVITLATPIGVPPPIGTPIGSIEFRLDVYLMRQPDPATPTRNAQVLDAESFRTLSLDPRHSRYVHKIIGTTWPVPSPSWLDDDGQPLRLVDNRSLGASQYVRVRDLGATVAIREGIRLAPELLTDTLPDGRVVPARLALTNGDDQIGTIGDPTYIGIDAAEPRDRTGLNALANVNEISVVAAPGRVGATIQGALVSHCELMRYRFAVLDGPAPPGDTIRDVQDLRQQFDTKLAALYHPWLVIPDPYPLSAAAPGDYPVPPSGHVAGIYARTDVDRGVHKAPANEVVRGITGLTRTLNKAQQDILNPYPMNVNVIRDFRTNNRGLRVYGGRCITSESDWKYVNVRRLVIFIEASLDIGLQWVVFEPNAEPLWARVRRSIVNFLTQVWRNGALEGKKPEEAFFVKCDRTTMTQIDIDQGRLICLVGVAPVKPAEYVIVRLGLWTAQADQQ